MIAMVKEATKMEIIAVKIVAFMRRRHLKPNDCFFTFFIKDGFFESVFCVPSAAEETIRS